MLSREETMNALARMREHERNDLRKRIMDPAHVEVREGVRYWRSNGAVIPPYVYDDAEMICPAIQSIAYRKHLDEFLADYKKQKLSPEARAEIRAELGDDVVDIFTGERI